jgi:prepilin-type N-terminal cleavage/methylation domain-containing protein
MRENNAPMQVRRESNRVHDAGPRRAFTLIELIVVMVLIAIMAAVAVPAIGNLTSTRASTAARQLARDLTFARQQAGARGVTIWVVFDTANESYSILAESLQTPGLANALTITDPATGQPFVQRFTSGDFVNVDLTSVSIGGVTGTHLGFDWLGRPVSSAGVVLASASSISINNGALTIAITPQTGFVTVQL